jgi:hypothetical protein
MKPAPAEAQIIELFHLAFLQVAQARLDQARYVVKSGASLRYFFESLRYSQDLDLDAVAIEPWKLEEKVDEVLAAPAFGLLLRCHQAQADRDDAALEALDRGQRTP